LLYFERATPSSRDVGDASVRDERQDHGEVVIAHNVTCSFVQRRAKACRPRLHRHVVLRQPCRAEFFDECRGFGEIREESGEKVTR
jgi:hypothetical protein